MKCEVSGLYGKDIFKNIIYYCQYCGKEMEYNEDRDCNIIPEKCECGNLIGDMDYSVGSCLECKKDIKKPLTPPKE